MKIGLYRYNLPFVEPIRFLDTYLPSRNGLLICKDGGWGEICPLTGFSDETIEEAEDEALTYIKHLKNGVDYFPELPHIRQILRRILIRGNYTFYTFHIAYADTVHTCRTE